MSLFLTWFDSNSWLVELAGQRLLIDPWLTGPLTFGNADWFFKGEHPEPIAPPESLDAIMLSQGLEDHAHRPTLRLFDRATPVIGSPSAAAVARDLGFTTVVELGHGDRHILNDAVAVTATVGAPVGPTTIENGYVLQGMAGGDRGEGGPSLYYEPHGYHAPNLSEFAPIDVTLSPLLDLCIWVLPILKGNDTAIDLARAVHPQVMLPTAAAGRVRYDGLLVNVIRQRGTLDEFRQALTEAGRDSRVIEPVPGQRLEVPLRPRATAAASMN